MKIRTRLKIMIVAASALVVSMGLLLYWSQQSLATATRANHLTNEIVSSIFERSILRSDYLRSDNLRSKNQWFIKQKQVNQLIQQALSEFDMNVGRNIIRSMQKDNDESAAVFLQIVANRESARTGQRQPVQANEIENRLMGQLLLKTYDTIDDTHRLQEASSQLIASTQKTSMLVSLFFIVANALFVIIVALSLSRIIGAGIKNLQEAAANIGAGNLRYTLPLTSSDEFAEVALAFNTMSAKLAESHAALEQEIGCF